MRDKKTPSVASLIDDAVSKTADIMSGNQQKVGIKPSDLAICVNILLAIEKNNRESQAAIAKGAPNWTDASITDQMKQALDEDEQLRALIIEHLTKGTQ